MSLESHLIIVVCDEQANDDLTRYTVQQTKSLGFTHPQVFRGLPYSECV